MHHTRRRVGVGVVVVGLKLLECFRYGLGPALELFERDKMDPEMTKRFNQIIEKGVHAEMCQVSMKAFDKTLDNLAKGFVALHPVAVKRIADLQREGYLYIKP